MLFYYIILLLFISVRAIELDHLIPSLKPITDQFSYNLKNCNSIIDLQTVINRIDQYKNLDNFKTEFSQNSNQAKLSNALKQKLLDLNIPFCLCQAIKDKHSLFIIGLLIRAGAPLHHEDEKGNKPLVEAIKVGDHNLIALLLRAGADVYTIDQFSKKNCIEIAQEQKDDAIVTIVNEHIDKMKKLFLNIRISNTEEIIKFIDENGHINMINKDEYPLYFPAMNNNESLIKLLIEHGADVEVTNSKKTRPLHAAACKNALQCAKLLLNAGALVSEKDASGKTPCDIARNENYTEMYTLLNEYLPNQENSSKNS